MAADLMTVHELRERGESIAMALEEAHATIKRAATQVKSLQEDLSGVRVRPTGLVRFEYEVTAFIGTLGEDLFGDGDFNIDRLSRDARDLVDLIDFAARPRASEMAA
ncbi:MAG: hypothetical protein JWM06_1671 [Actinomycetia bacterium]|jgi:hypothetical protein|nr:hypothetical protein [Actinomycetes bacterium]